MNGIKKNDEFPYELTIYSTGHSANSAIETQKQDERSPNNSKEPCEPLLIIVEQFSWACENIKKFKGTIDEKKFRVLAEHLQGEIKKYIFE